MHVLIRLNLTATQGAAVTQPHFIHEETKAQKVNDLLTVVLLGRDQ